jgi:AcrR family transcriptional regulator
MATGLRERKKQLTRDAIAQTAMALFVERGFDAVTVAEIARAADVAEKTVFNYFPAKEDLVFVAGADRRAALLDALRSHAPGESLVAPFRAQTLAFLDLVAKGPVEEIVAVPRLVAASTTLRNRLFLGWEQEAAELTPVLAGAAGVPEDDLVAAVVARALAWTHRMVFRAAFQRLLAGEDRRKVARDLRRDARRAYDQLEQGLAGFGT